MIQYFKNKFAQSNRITKDGYTLLFATLTAALVLGVAAFILGIARKQYILSSTARDSIYAFYAADAGIECIAKNAKSSRLLSTTSAPYDPFTITCANNPTIANAGTGISVSYNTHLGSLSTTYSNVKTPKGWLSLSLGFADEAHDPSPDPAAKDHRWGCAKITIDQYVDNQDNLNSVVTSRGYNLCNESGGNYVPDPSSPRTVERALQWTTVR